MTKLDFSFKLNIVPIVSIGKIADMNADAIFWVTNKLAWRTAMSAEILQQSLNDACRSFTFTVHKSVSCDTYTRYSVLH